MEAYIEDNSFKKTTAAAVLTSFNKSQVMVKRNAIHDFQLIGISGVDNGGTHFLEANTITNPNPVQNSLGTAISYQNAITGMILKITNDNKTQNVRTGIHAVNIGLLTVDGNPDINFSPGSSTAAAYGVRLANCQNALVRQNKIWGSLVNNDRNKPNTYCVHISNSPGVRFELNDFRNAGKGFWGTGVLANVNLLCNVFTNTEKGAELNSVSSFGPVAFGAANPSDNVWRNTGPQAVGDDVLCTGITVGNSFVWRVRANNTGPYVYVPNPSTSLGGGASAVVFIPPYATGSSPCNPGPIANPGNGGGGGQGQNLCQDPPCRDLKFLPLVANQVTYPNLQQENEWHGKYHAYKTFLNDPAWLNLGVSADTLYQIFFNVTDQTSIGTISRMEESIAQDSFSLATFLSYGLVPTNMAETNHKRLSEIYLNTWAVGIDTFTHAEQGDLLAIANQCPISGGQAVYGARVMLNLDLADSCGANSGNRQMGSSSESQFTQSFVIYPNPNDGKFTIKFRDLEAPISCKTQDLTGRVCLVSELRNPSSEIELDISALPAGTYLIELSWPNGKTERVKVSVVK